MDDLLRKHCPGGVPYLPIGDPRVSKRVVAGATPASGVAAYWEAGTIPWMSSGEVNSGTITGTDKRITQAGYDSCSTKLVPAGTVVIALAGQGKTRGRVARTRIELCTNQSLASVVVSSVNSDFLYYFLQTQYRQLRELSSGDDTRGGLNLQMIRAYRIPVPPLPVQEEIARVLDSFQGLHAALSEELEARRLQFDYYRRSLLISHGSPHAEWKTIGEIGRVAMCKRIFKAETTTTGDVPFYKIGTFGGAPDAFISRTLFDDYRRRYPFPKKGDVLISAAGTIGRAVAYDGQPAYFQDSNIVWIDNDETTVLNRFLFHWYSVVEWTTDRSTIHRLYNDNLKRTKILVPPLSEQRRIVAILDNFDALANDPSEGLSAEISARRAQYEYYRDRLLTFDEEAAA